MAEYRNPYRDPNPQINEIDTDITKERLSIEKEVAQAVQQFKVQLVKNGYRLESDEAKKLVKDQQEYLKKLKEKQRKDEQSVFKADQKAKQKEEEKQLKENHKKALQYQVEEFQERKRLGEEISKEEKKNARAAAKELQKIAVEDSLQKAMEKTVSQLYDVGSWANQQMQQVMSSYAQYQSSMNVRLQGTSQTFQSLQKSLLNNVGITPYIKTQNMLNNLQTLVTSGIAFNLEQRAFLMSISDKIAATFDANTSTLRQIIRLQQEDSTAGRLGMEAYMTRFLNGMFENTEYLVDSFDSVTGALIEATSQMTTQMGVEFEYVVQKWLGSLSSVGLSSNTVTNIAQAIGYLASGDVSGLEGSTMQQLLVMAASRAGLDYGKMLSGGVTTRQANTLLSSLVTYMQEIGSSSNNVVRNQFAKTFGLSMSDLRAAANLKPGDITNISKNLLSYTGAITELGSQMKQVSGRLSVAEMLENVKDNAMYSMFSTIAASPALYALWSITDMIQSYTGGINIPAFSVLGTGVDLNTTVENLMKLGIMGIGSMGMIGDIVSGIGNTVNFSNALSALGIGTNVIGTSRGGGIGSLGGGLSESASSYIGQSSGSSFYEQTMSRANQESAQKLEQMQTQTEEQPIDTINSNVAAILTLLQEGIKVSVDNYGLTTSNI